MSKVDEAWQVFDDLRYQYPFWPSTFTTCRCGRELARGCSRCSLCLVEELTKIVGSDLAARADLALREVNAAWYAIRHRARQEDALDKLASVTEEK
jgi:hypothetical protein